MTTTAVPDRAATNQVLTEVWHERVRQDNRWGVQNHPDGTGGLGFELAAQFARLDCQQAAAAGECTWMHVLNEEVGEAFAETAPATLRAELIQVAAVAVAWIEALDHRTRAGGDQ